MEWVGGRVGGGWVGSRRRVKGFHKDTDSNAVSSVSDRKRLNPQDRSRWSLAAVWH